MKTETVRLFHGFQNDITVIYDVNLKELNGHDEQYLYENFNSSISSFLIATHLLKRLVSDIDNKIQSEDILERISIGDRNKLLLHLRRLTIGDKINCTVTCLSCKENLSLELSITEILSILPPQPIDYSVTIDSFLLQLRPLCGSDQRLLFEGDRMDPTRKFLRSCITSSEPKLTDSELTNKFLSSVASKLEEIDPLANPVLNVNCPNCGESFEAPLDVEGFVLQEMSMLGKWLEREVHWLAFNYHWSENSILSMSMTRRRKYVDLINRTLEGDQI
jgi:hypothetical protein